MRRFTLLVALALVLTSCASAPPSPTATTGLPTDTPLPPTETSIPPTPTPNPEGERVLMALNEAVNNKDIEAGSALFTPNATLWIGLGEGYEGENAAKEFLTYEINFYGAFWKFSEFNVKGDDVSWVWFVGGGRQNRVCMGHATMQEDHISFLSIRCGSQITPTASDL